MTRLKLVPNSLYSNKNEYYNIYLTADHNYSLPGKRLARMPEPNFEIISELIISEPIPNQDLACPASSPVTALHNA